MQSSNEENEAIKSDGRVWLKGPHMYMYQYEAKYNEEN